MSYLRKGVSVMIDINTRLITNGVEVITPKSVQKIDADGNVYFTDGSWCNPVTLEGENKNPRRGKIKLIKVFD